MCILFQVNESEMSSRIDSASNSVFETTRDVDAEDSVNTTTKSSRGGRRVTRGRPRKRKSSEAEVGISSQEVDFNNCTPKVW